jgi:hypothetical protein
MSFTGWLDKQRVRRQEKRITRHKKHIKNKFGQGEDRQKAIDFFQSLPGTEGALGLLERFMVNVEPSIRDESEKGQVFSILVDRGTESVEAVELYLNRKDAANVPVTWALKVLDAICEPEEAAGVIIRALEQLGTSYTREPERKVALVTQLAEYDDERVVPALIPFLRDHRDEVQLEAIRALTRRADETGREPMLELMIDEDTPVRIRAQLAAALQQLGWAVKGYRKKVEESLPEGLSVDRSGRIKGRWTLAPAEDRHEES